MPLQELVERYKAAQLQWTLQREVEGEVNGRLRRMGSGYFQEAEETER